MQNLINGRCGWCGTDELYVAYHDNEWGRLVKEDKILFEFLLLESAQAGLSWITILKKREGYRAAFHNFEIATVAQMAELPEEIERYKEQVMPAIIQIPGVSGNTGAGVEGVKKTVEQAVGSDILFSQE